MELDPFSAVNLADLGRILFFRATLSLRPNLVFEKAIALDPDFSYAHRHYGEIAARQAAI